MKGHNDFASSKKRIKDRKYTCLPFLKAFNDQFKVKIKSHKDLASRKNWSQGLQCNLNKLVCLSSDLYNFTWHLTLNYAN